MKTMDVSGQYGSRPPVSRRNVTSTATSWGAEVNFNPVTPATATLNAGFTIVRFLLPRSSAVYEPEGMPSNSNDPSECKGVEIRSAGPDGKQQITTRSADGGALVTLSRTRPMTFPLPFSFFRATQMSTATCEFPLSLRPSFNKSTPPAVIDWIR